MRILTNISHLNDAIDYYEKIEKHLPYIFMNKETMERVCSGYINMSMLNCEASVLEYYGCRVFENNTLDFFEFELR